MTGTSSWKLVICFDVWIMCAHSRRSSLGALVTLWKMRGSDSSGSSSSTRASSFCACGAVSGILYRPSLSTVMTVRSRCAGDACERSSRHVGTLSSSGACESARPREKPGGTVRSAPDGRLSGSSAATASSRPPGRNGIDDVEPRTKLFCVDTGRCSESDEPSSSCSEAPDTTSE